MNEYFAWTFIVSLLGLHGTHHEKRRENDVYCFSYIYGNYLSSSP